MKPPLMEREPTADELAVAERELVAEGWEPLATIAVRIEPCFTQLIRERALRRRAENLFCDRIEEVFTAVEEGARRVGCLEEVARLVILGFRAAVDATQDEELQASMHTAIASMEEAIAP